MRGDAENTPLQLKLNNLAELIAKAGAGAGLILFVALMIRFFVGLSTDPNRSVCPQLRSMTRLLFRADPVADRQMTRPNHSSRSSSSRSP
jgi:Ca2+-transporting ATPase